VHDDPHPLAYFVGVHEEGGGQVPVIFRHRAKCRLTTRMSSVQNPTLDTVPRRRFKFHISTRIPRHRAPYLERAACERQIAVAGYGRTPLIL
jgi:hypothetical protein